MLGLMRAGYLTSCDPVNDLLLCSLLALRIFVLFDRTGPQLVIVRFCVCVSLSFILTVLLSVSVACVT